MITDAVNGAFPDSRTYPDASDVSRSRLCINGVR